MQVTGLVLVMLMTGVTGTQAPATRVPPAPEQPLPYSHKRHLAMVPDCKMCHAMPAPGDAAALPATATCMACHTQVKTDSPAIQRLAEYHKTGEPVPWKRVYRLPDYVFFSHQTHVTKGVVTCEACHGPVQDMEVMQRVKDISMAACVECHKEKAAPTGCTACHDPL